MAISMKHCIAVLSLLTCGCTRLSPTQEGPQTARERSRVATVDESPTAQGKVQVHDSPEISRSTGVDGGTVVFWPRIVPRSSDPTTHDLAAAVQGRAADIARKAAPGKPPDVRPEPERVCPRAGCVGVSVGVLLVRRGDACAAAALVSG